MIDRQRKSTMPSLLLILVAFVSPTLLSQTSKPTTKPIVPRSKLAENLGALTSEEFAGRGRPNIEKSRALITREYKRLGLVPVGKDFRFQFAASGLRGTNMIGLLKSTHPKKKSGHIIVSAHYDHLGRRGGKAYVGACDNASGVVAMLEVARRLKSNEIERDILFIAFDLEENGLLGSYAYAEKPLLPLSSCHFFITMDMLGRKALGILDNHMFVQGWEWTPEVLPDIDATSFKAKISLQYFWTDVGGDRSDFVAFKKKRIPHLFFTVGQNEDYHLPSDTAAKIDLDLLKRQIMVVTELTKRLAKKPAPYRYRQVPDLNLVEFTSLATLSTKLAKSSHKRVTPDLRKQAMGLSSFATRVVRSGKVTSNDRSVLLRLVRVMQKTLR